MQHMRPILKTWSDVNRKRTSLALLLTPCLVDLIHQGFGEVR